ncbi:aldehyde dehydrogenase [Loa loa]|uniref:Aldehyde dehydrogenase n=1 Tax=Loa loa TaxID=7209 RepID=A0A1I7V626_LOALO|nr:aldehyde dehydrogenase [Loa loa]EFO25562.1 aldehyde dehydrogenase [Loa loa]
MFFKEADIAIGDIVFFKKGDRKNGDQFSEAIADVALESVIHVALLYEDTLQWVIHASRESGVCQELLKDVIEKLNPESFEVYRAQVSQTVRINACKWAKSKVGANYNDIFSPDMRDSKGSEAFYCCQLLVKSYEAAGINDFCPIHQLTFNDSTGKLLPFWEKYYQERSLPIPQGLQGSHPAKLIQSKYLKLHFVRFRMPLIKFVVPKTIDNALHFINGARVALKATKHFDIYQPRNGEILARCGCANTEVIDEVVKEAYEAQKFWADLNIQQRGTVLLQAASIIRSVEDQLAYWETIDCGKAIKESRWDMIAAADTFEFFGGAMHNIAGNHFPLSKDNYAYTERVPWGIVGAIGVWNYPMLTASWKIAPALMCGNAVLYKPSPFAPVTGVLLAQILQAAGLPDGVLSVLQGEGETGQAICEHGGINKVSFTGSTATGSKILGSCSLFGRIKPVTLELGGKSAMIVCEDADIDVAITGAFMANFFSQGEVCSNASKVLVHISCYEEFRKKVMEQTKNLVVGDPLLKETKIGATISREHLNKVKAYIDEAVQEGAKLLCGGDEVIVKGLENGYYLSPAVLDSITEQMRIYKEEVFGAVMLIIPFQNNEDAIRMANDTPYGLAAGVFTRNLHLAYSLASKLHAGNVYVNTYNITNPMIPFGGMKQSGFGRENGIAALEAFSQLKSIYVNASEKLDNPFL